MKFSLVSDPALIFSIPLASTLELNLMADLAICVISFASASALAFAISKASVLALVSLETLVLSDFSLILASDLPPSNFPLLLSLALAPNLN